MRRAGVANPVILLDELDKLDPSGAPAAALLEALDPTQARKFTDNYLGVPLDLSGVLFIATANSLETVGPALRNRFELIELPSYSGRERREIAHRHLWPAARLAAGLPTDLELPEAILRILSDEYGREPGVRELSRLLNSVARRLALAPLPDGPTPAHLSVWFGTPEVSPARSAGGRRGECLALMVSARGGEAV
ncbi:MAG: endopeptidase La, partial [Armatimonadota bacterium]